MPGTNNYVTVDGAIHHNSGKSVACAHELMRWATLQEPDKDNLRRTRFLIVRNTVDQLRSTTFKTITDWFPPEVFGHYRATEKTIHYRLALADGTTVQSEWMLISLDDPADIRKALSLEATGLFGNECRELHPDVVDGLLMRVNRYPSRKDVAPTRAGAIFDTNMPGEDSWWEQQMSNPPSNWSVHIQPPAVFPLEVYQETFRDDPDPLMVFTDVDGNAYAVNPDADNLENLPEDYYPQTGEGKKEDFVNVYLRGNFGRSLSGQPVYDKTFKPDVHVAKTPLQYVRSEEYGLCIGLDFGRSPAAIIGQQTPMGQVLILSEVIGENMGIQTFVMTMLRPHLTTHYPGMPCFIAADPAGWQKTQVSDVSPVDYLQQAGFRVVKPKTNKPKLRIEAVDTLLMASADARPRLQIDPSCRTLIKGFRGGYKWKTTKAGNLIESPEPIKNHYSHCHDAMQYLAMIIDAGFSGRKMQADRTVTVARAAGWT